MKRASVMGATALAMLLGGALPSGFPAPVAGAQASPGSDPAQKSSPVRGPEFDRLFRLALMSRGKGRSGVGGFIGRGWSVATDRRKARKARNVARNRSAQR